MAEADELRAQLAAERKRREEVEDLWHEEQQAHTAAVTRAEIAEREREEARRDKRDMGGIISRTMDALDGDPDDNMVGLARARMGDLKRAEADNAVLVACVKMLRREAPPSGRMAIVSEVERWEVALADSWDVVRADHPGAAMLERMRALEEAAKRASAELRHTYRPETRDWNLVSRAIQILERVTTPT